MGFLLVLVIAVVWGGIIGYKEAIRKSNLPPEKVQKEYGMSTYAKYWSGRRSHR